MSSSIKRSLTDSHTHSISLTPPSIYLLIHAFNNYSQLRPTHLLTHPHSHTLVHLAYTPTHVNSCMHINVLSHSLAFSRSLIHAHLTHCLSHTFIHQPNHLCTYPTPHTAIHTPSHSQTCTDTHSLTQLPSHSLIDSHSLKNPWLHTFLLLHSHTYA